MTPSDNFYDLLVDFEGLRLNAYRDSAGIPTIGIGSIKYPNGTKVHMGDVCTKDEAYEWARYEAGIKARKLNELIEGLDLNQNEFDALLLLMYNIGEAGLAGSTLLKRIKSGTGNITEAWMRWNKARVNGVLQPINGLTKRRAKEVSLYLKPIE